MMIKDLSFLGGLSPFPPVLKGRGGGGTCLCLLRWGGRSQGNWRDSSVSVDHKTVLTSGVRAWRVGGVHWSHNRDVRLSHQHQAGRVHHPHSSCISNMNGYTQDRPFHNNDTTALFQSYQQQPRQQPKNRPPNQGHPSYHQWPPWRWGLWDRTASILQLTSGLVGLTSWKTGLSETRSSHMERESLWENRTKVSVWHWWV